MQRAGTGGAFPGKHEPCRLDAAFAAHFFRVGISRSVVHLPRPVLLAAERGRVTRNDIKLGICGEHGGDPASIEFCEKAKLNYVSCSPYRVPAARLAAAQAYLKKKK